MSKNKNKKFPYFIQSENKDCGPTCLKIIAKYHGKIININYLRDLSETTREGSNLLFLSDTAEKIGFRTLGVKRSASNLKELPLPCILHWDKSHFVVLYKIKNNRFYISDPAIGLIDYNLEDFIKFWIGNNANENTEEGIALLIEPTPIFYKSEFDTSKNFDFTFLKKYIYPYKSYLIQLSFGLLAGSIIQLILPFLTQSIVDIGIQNQNINFIYLVLFAQLFLFFGQTALELIRGWILLHLSTRINVSLISDFFIKLMNLPISYFDVKMTGDIMQRINDHQRIERILTTSSLEVLFSVVNMFVMGVVLAYYNLSIFTIYLICTIVYFLWIMLFLKRRAKLDHVRFAEMAKEQSKVIELVNGMQEIKLHNAEKQKRWGWEYVQARLFKISIKGLILDQTQNTGSNIVNQLKNIGIIFLSAKLVIDGELTLGMMLSISAIVGGLDGPIFQLINFIREAQDAKIALERLGEIHDKQDEIQQEQVQTHEIPDEGNIFIQNLNYRYPGSDKFVLQNLNLVIPQNKITAIVGSSGSGKTTLLKLLLKFYEPTNGRIKISNKELSQISNFAWRNQLGVVMQEGYIFNDTIANNIALGVNDIDKKRLLYASKTANIDDFITSLPLGYNTIIGTEGVGMSTGQKQRLLIARAVYKNPNMLLFDEATSSLDSNNEKEIMKKLNNFFDKKTVIIIAHRLSTVINADQIVVLEDGQVIEIGKHDELIKQKGKYYNLVKNQLQLGT